MYCAFSGNRLLAYYASICCYARRCLLCLKLCQHISQMPTTLPQESLPHIMQMLFICTGCDYISYFSGFGKASVLNIFYQHAQFITSGCPILGTLSDTDDPSKGLLAFMRLVGTLYFKKIPLSIYFKRLRDPTTIIPLTGSSIVSGPPSAVAGKDSGHCRREDHLRRRACALSWGSLETLAEVLLGVQNVGQGYESQS